MQFCWSQKTNLLAIYDIQILSVTFVKSLQKYCRRYAIHVIPTLNRMHFGLKSRNKGFNKRVQQFYHYSDFKIYFKNYVRYLLGWLQRTESVRRSYQDMMSSVTTWATAEV